MKQLLLPIAFVLATALHAQSSFQKAISLPFNQGLYPSCISPCSDGGFLLGTGASAGSGQALIRTNSSGQVTWTKMLQSEVGSNMDIKQAEECLGGYLVFGEYSSLADTAFGFPSVSYFLTKLTATGSISWSKTYTVQGSSYQQPKMKQLNNGHILISTSQFEIMGAIELDGNGNVIWSNSFRGDTSTTYPKNPGFDCAVNSDGSMLFSGKSVSNIVLVKTDANGNIQWTMDLTNGYSYYHANSIIPLSGGGYLVAGYQDWLGFLMKIDAAGTILWYKSFTNVSSIDKVIQLPNGQLEALGQTFISTPINYASNSLLIRFTTTGAIIDAYSLGEGYSVHNNVPSICATSTGAIGLVGTEYNGYNQGQSMTLFRTNTAGTVPCQFEGFVLAEDNAVLIPNVVSQATVVRQSQPCIVQTHAFSIATIAYIENDFCILFGQQEAIGNSPTLEIFPSPIAAGENVQLKISGITGNSKLSIYDSNGKLVNEMSQEFSANQESILEIPTAALTSGIYLVRITGEQNEVVGTTKFMVR